MAFRIIKKEVDKKPSEGSGIQWSTKQRREALELYRETGNLSATSRTLGIPLETLKLWKSKEWWKEAMEERQLQTITERGKRMEKLIDLASGVIEDSLQNGDKRITQTGEVIRVPVNAKTATAILDSSFSKAVEMEDRINGNLKKETEEKSEERLKKLFLEFARFAKAHEVNINLPTDDNNNALHDQRQEGLQEGTGVGEADNRQGSSE
jgi:hypothetical protein